MQVGRAIELLKKIYNLDDELMIDWVDKEQIDGEMTDEVWSWAVGMIEGSYEGMIDLYYVQDTVNEAQRDLKKEEEDD